MSECIGCFGTWFGHKFRGRYSTEEFLPPGLKTGSFEGGPDAYAQMIDSWKTKRSTYHHDVCERCGELRASSAPNTETA